MSKIKAYAVYDTKNSVLRVENGSLSKDRGVVQRAADRAMDMLGIRCTVVPVVVSVDTEDRS